MTLPPDYEPRDTTPLKAPRLRTPSTWLRMYVTGIIFVVFVVGLLVWAV